MKIGLSALADAIQNGYSYFMMKKNILLLFVFMFGALVGANASIVRRSVEQKVTGVCLTQREFDAAVQQRDFRRIENTLLRAQTKADQQKWLRRAVKAQGRVISVPEYFVATAGKGETAGLKRVLALYGSFYAGDKQGAADNLLEKLAVRHDVERKMELVQTIFSAFGINKISNRTFLYIVSEATDQSGYQFARFVANKKGAACYTDRRDTDNYPMPYALTGAEDVCRVLSDRLNADLTDSQRIWLKKTKELFCPVRQAY